MKTCSWMGLAALLATGLVACGGDDEGSSAGTPSSGGTGGSSGGAGGVAGAATGGIGGATGGIGGQASGGSMTGGVAGVGGSGGVAAGGGAGGNGGSASQALLADLGSSVWSGLQTRGGVERAYELQFDAASLVWVEIRNPFGPSRIREMRSFTIADDMSGVPQLSSTVISPSLWPIHPENGRMDDWTLEIIDGSPRQLEVTRDGVTETFEESPWPAPESGLTAVVRTFPSSGDVFDAFCDVSGSLSGSIDYQTILDFARGKGATQPLAEDVVAGVQLGTWEDLTGNNQFAVTDLDGFDRLGGTTLSDQFNFTVSFVGTLTHSGGDVFMREEDDSVTDALWVFLDDGVGSANVNDIFFENHSITLVGDDETVSDTFAAGDLPFEAIAVRCSSQLEEMTLQMGPDGSSWSLISANPTKPEINVDLFPPGL